MKKAILLLAILTISIFSTACINNFAVQELNSKAKVFMDKGDYQGAIARLKSSIDLDPSIFESYYNLAVAYTKDEDYSNAIDAYNHAIKLNPEFADAYYSLAVCEENLAEDLISGYVKLDSDGSYIKLTEDEVSKLQGKPKLDKVTKSSVYSLFTKAEEDYTTYISKSKDKASIEDAQNKINELKSMSNEYEEKGL